MAKRNGYYAVYCPVAVIPQVTSNVTELLAGMVVTVAPLASKKLLGVAGQVAPPVRLAGAQVTEVHDRPALAASFSTAPSAASGPALLATTV